MTKLKSFTLSEIMIAMVIIAIVATVTIPVFIDVMNGRGYKAKYKKTITTLTRAAAANYGENTYDFRDVNAYYSEDGVVTECYDSKSGAGDGAFVGSDTEGFTDGNISADLNNKAMSIFNIFHSFLNMRHSAQVQNYDVGPVAVELKCAQNEPDGSSVNIKMDGKEANVKLINKFEGRLGHTYGGFAPLCKGRLREKGGINQGRMFMMDDGSVFTYDPAQTYCTESNPCFGYIDVNGPQPPNQVIACSKGEDSYILTYGRNANEGNLQGSCEVKAQDITDIYPVLFYDQIVKPASWAAKAVFFDHIKSNQVGDVIVPE